VLPFYKVLLLEVMLLELLAMLVLHYALQLLRRCCVRLCIERCDALLLETEGQFVATVLCLACQPNSHIGTRPQALHACLSLTTYVMLLELLALLVLPCVMCFTCDVIAVRIASRRRD
jgi:hypothetical protein